VPQASGTNPPWVTSPPPPTPQSIPRPASRRTTMAGSGGGSFLAGFLFASLSPPIYNIYTKARTLSLYIYLSLLFSHTLSHSLVRFLSFSLFQCLSRSALAQSSALLHTPSPVPRRVGRILHRVNQLRCSLY